MAVDPNNTSIYHITDIANLESILQSGGLHSDKAMEQAGATPAVIGYASIKWRRMNEYTIACAGNRFVGEFIPFYFCPRSPMLSTINKGNTGRAPGCQKDILHLVSNVGLGMSLGRQWAISDGNAGAAYTTFSNAPGALDAVNWGIVTSNNWGGDRLNAKCTEFLVADFYPVTAFTAIGCHNEQTANAARAILQRYGAPIPVSVNKHWYY